MTQNSDTDERGEMVAALAQTAMMVAGLMGLTERRAETIS
jgi:hypothetical protein